MRNFDWKAVVGSVTCYALVVALIQLNFVVTSALAVKFSAVGVWFNDTSSFRCTW